MTLEQALRFIEAKEAGKRSASRLVLPQATDVVAGNSYKKQKKATPTKTSSKEQDTCTYCGTRGHGQNPPTRIRRKECPAFGTKCSYCDKDHHFEKMCRDKQGAQSAISAKHEDALTDVLCEVTSMASIKRTSLTHHVFDKLTKQWLKRRSKSQP